MSDDQVPSWQVIGATVRGAMHVRRGTPNQDAIAWKKAEDPHDTTFLAVADGHGAPPHFRSNAGSRFAVRAAISVLERFAIDSSGLDAAAVIDTAKKSLGRELVDTWRSHVSQDLEQRPLTARELDTAIERAPDLPVERLHADPAIAYGSTVIAALLTGDYGLYLQLGDGNIVEVTPEGAAPPPALPDDPLLLGNQTTSLCSPDALRHVRICVQPSPAETPTCIMLSTDGYANSFVDAAGLRQAALDLCAVACEQGMFSLALQLPAWLRATSRQGSGDDITVGLALRAGK